MSPLIMSFAILPKINGTTIKKENRAALVLSIPSSTAVDMVAPLLEIPGKIAIAWARPTKKAFFVVKCFLHKHTAEEAKNVRRYYRHLLFM